MLNSGRQGTAMPVRTLIVSGKPFAQCGKNGGWLWGVTYSKKVTRNRYDLG